MGTQPARAKTFAKWQIWLFIPVLLTVTTLLLPAPLTAQEASLSDRIAKVANELPGPWYLPGKSPETPDQRSSRLNMISDVIAVEAPKITGTKGWWWTPDDLAWAAFIMTYHESSKFHLKVHDGRLRGDKGRSVCLGQIMLGSKDLVGTDRASTERCIDKTMEFLVMHQHRCLHPKMKPGAWSVSMIYAGYGTGHSCSATIGWAQSRAWSWWLVRNGKRLPTQHSQ